MEFSADEYLHLVCRKGKQKHALKLEDIVFKEVPIITQSTHQNSPVSQKLNHRFGEPGMFPLS
jgi:hypothetical protein